jgi:hypothetical protein
VTADPASEPKKESVPAQSEATPGTEPSPEPTEAPTPEPTEAPTPEPTPEPKEGEIALHFPDYDTGVDAEYSYQSDELRIAIRRYEDPEICSIYYVADIWMRNISCFRAGFGNGAFNHGNEDAESFSTREHAILAINGSYNKGLVIHDGVLKKKLDDKHTGVMVLYRDGSMETVRRTSFDLAAAQEKGIVHAWQFGPMLVHDGKPSDANYNTYATRHSRIIFGYYEPGHYVAVAVDGRRKDAIGMNNLEMVELMTELGCKEAMNLDGGYSAIMTFMGKIVNDPPKPDSKEEEKGGRKLMDMLLFAEYDANGNAPSLDEITADRVPQD